ncbi:MAG: sialidase family protein, partial [Actinomycetota bacterium]|nr:sialidase family protein [Actinomycetota bacterium]
MPRRVVSCLVATVLGTAGVVAGGGGPAAATAAQPGTATGRTASWTDWSVGSQLPPPTGGLDAVSCPTTTDCVAVGANANGGGSILTTTDGGATWSDRVAPTVTFDINGVQFSSRGYVLDGVSCSSTQACVAVGTVSTRVSFFDVVDVSAAILTSTDGGVTWTSQSVPNGVTQLAAVSCPSTTSCVAVGSAILTSTDGGVTWTSQSVPSGVTQLAGAACPSTTSCVA